MRASRNQRSRVALIAAERGCVQMSRSAPVAALIPPRYEAGMTKTRGARSLSRSLDCYLDAIQDSTQGGCFVYQESLLVVASGDCGCGSVAQIPLSTVQITVQPSSRGYLRRLDDATWVVSNGRNNIELGARTTPPEAPESGRRRPLYRAVLAQRHPRESHTMLSPGS